LQHQPQFIDLLLLRGHLLSQLFDLVLQAGLSESGKPRRAHQEKKDR